MATDQGGFIAISRSELESPVFRSLRADQRSVYLSLYTLANWAPDSFYYGTRLVEVGRGQLAHSIKTIAQHAGVSYDVTRNVIDKLILSGHLLDTSRTLASKTPHPGTTVDSREPRVLTIVNYNVNRETPALRAVATTTPSTTPLPRPYHAPTTPLPPREEDQEDKKTKKLKRINTLSGRKPDHGVSGLEVFEFWKVKHKHPGAIFTVDRKKAVGAMLAEGYSADQLKLAVSGILQSPHHCGQNDRSTKYLDLTHVCKSGKNVEAFIALATGEDIKPTKINGYSRAEDQHHEIVGTITEWHIPSLDGPDSRRGKEAAGGQGSQGSSAPENVPTSGHP